MHEQRIRIGIIGAGGIFRQRHLPNLKKVDGVELVAVCNRSEESSRAMAAEYGITHIVTDWRRLIERDDIDAVMIGTWPYMHKEMSIAALKAGKHVFCQARMCMDWAEALAMHEAAKRHPNQVAMICPPPHRMPWEPYIRSLIDGGELGEIRHVQLQCLDASNADVAKVTWREQFEFSGIQIMQVGIWAETLNAWLGDYHILSAITATPIAQKTDSNGNPYDIRIPQIVAIQGTLASGATISELHSGLSLHEQTNHVTIFGSKATLRVDAMKSIQLGRAGQAMQPVDVPKELCRDWRVERDFIDAVRTARNGDFWHVDPDFAAGLRYMRKMQAIADSAARGAAIELDKDYPLPA